jgi:aminopeptidase N
MRLPLRRLWVSLIVFACAALVGLPEAGAQLRGNRRAVPPPTATPAADRPATPPAEPLRTPGDRPVDIRDIRLELRVDLKDKTAEGKATLQFRTLKPTRSLSLDAVDFQVKNVRWGNGANGQGQTARFTHDGKKLVVELPSRWPAGKEGTLQVDYRVHEPKDGLHFFAPGPKDPETPLLVWSQGEPTSNRYWFPCIDQPDQRQTTRMIVTVPAGCEAVSNGKLLDHKENKDHTVTFDWLQDKPHPSYLVTLVVGQFDVVHEEWEGIPLLYYVPKGKAAEARVTFAHTRDMLTFFSRRFGIRYPWDKYAQIAAFEFGGGMENTSATTLGDRTLQDERSIIDRSPDGLVSHELAHQWWGDLVTCRDWSHLWLNEGFASYAEALWDEQSHGADEYAYNLYRKAQVAITGGKKRPVMDRRYTDPGSMFDARSYPKGAWVLHMLRRHLGDDAFFKGLERYGIEFRLQPAETSDFRRVLERTSGRDLDRFFYDWVERPGNPDLEVTTEYLPDAQQAKIVVKQTQSEEPFHIPLKLALYVSGSEQPIILEQEMTEKLATFQVPVAGPLARIDVDPDQKVLATIQETKPPEMWRAQLLEARDVPARLRAVDHLAKEKTDQDRELLARAFTGEKFWGLKVELARALGTAGGDVSRDALLQGLQHEDPRVRRACVEGLGSLKPNAAVASVLKEVLRKGDASYAVEGAALEAYARQGSKDAVAVISPWLEPPSHDHELTSAALTALGHAADPAVVDRLLEWTQPAKPRDCRLAALRGLTQAAQKTKLTEAQRRRVVQLLNEALQSDGRFQRFVVLRSLPELGSLATGVLPALDKMSKDDPNDRVREMAKSTAQSIRDKSRMAPAADNDVSGLRDQIKRLEQEMHQLRKRLDRYESSERTRRVAK